MELPAWNIETEYPSLESSEYKTDEARCQAICAEMDRLFSEVRGKMQATGASKSGGSVIPVLQKLLLLNNEAKVLLLDLSTYASCRESVDATDEAAKVKASEIQMLVSQFTQSFKPVQLFLMTCTSELFNEVMQHPELLTSRFTWEQQRLLGKTLLSESEEILMAALTPSGFTAWGDLYSTLAGTMKVKFNWNGEVREIGIAEASGRTRSSNESERKAAWIGIQQAWRENQEPAAAILNSLAGWRLEVAKKRSHTVHVDHFTMPLFMNRIQKTTLDAMLTAVQANKAEIQQAAFLMARAHGKKQLDPWDVTAPAPLAAAAGAEKISVPFEQGLRMIRDAFQKVHPEFGEFVDLMKQNQWIEARVLPYKRNGAFCTGFAKSKTPRVLQTYLGSYYDISTLAHELGHAYHSWVIRDQSFDEMDYPMTLAETASIFAETVLADEMLAAAATPEEKMKVAWSYADSAVSLLLNIPARFEFESMFYEKRRERALSARELTELTDQAWSKWYGPTLSANDTMFWASKLHFSMTDVSFYNFPYTFGYLFALSIYGRRAELGDQFWPKYTAILRDTGRMTAEDLVMKHLGEDISRPEFWQKAINVVKSQVAVFASLAEPSK